MTLAILADLGGTNTRVALADGAHVRPDSIRRFPNMQDFEGMIRAAGFRNTKVEPILGGLVAIHSGWKV